MGKPNIIAIRNEERAVVCLEEACRALAEVSSIAEAKCIGDQAEAFRRYARRQKLGRKAELDAAEIARRADFVVGEMLARLPRQQGKRLHQTSDIECLTLEVAIRENGYSNGLARQLQTIATSIPSEEREDYIRRQRDSDREPSRVGLLKLAKKVKARQWEEVEVEAIAAVAELPDGCRVEVARMQDFLPALTGLDAVITDPPYEEEYLPLYGELARLAAKALAPDGVLAVMCGQYHLPRVLALMTPHIPYRWSLAYLTPGGQSVQVWSRKVNTFWKPVLLFGAPRDWLTDVARSDVNDNDKRFHRWGQSAGGMASLVRLLTKPGQLVCDPFLGGATTAAACLSLGRRFVGCDADPECVKTARARIQEALTHDR